MDFKIGSKVKYKMNLVSGAHRQNQGITDTGTVINVHDNLPGQGGQMVDIKFEDGNIECGIRTSQIEHA